MVSIELRHSEDGSCKASAALSFQEYNGYLNSALVICLYRNLPRGEPFEWVFCTSYGECALGIADEIQVYLLYALTRNQHVERTKTAVCAARCFHSPS